MAEKFTAVEMLREAKREAQARAAIYDKRVKRGEMNIADATRQIALMQAIADHFKPLAKVEEDAAKADEPRMF